MSRSSCSTIGTAVWVLSRAASPSTAAVCSFGSPERRRGHPDTTTRQAVRLGGERFDLSCQLAHLTIDAGHRQRLPRSGQHAARVGERESDTLPAVVDAERRASDP